ncbi:MAG: hypothetical protein L3K14_04570 [Thermoplasmata archaeon]|nr:hypothetical protein [Thermoplasmata archaeon]
MTPTNRAALPEAPAPFGISRELPPGGYPLTKVFPGFTKVPPFAKYPTGARSRTSMVAGTKIQVVAGPTWMYVAPREVPPFAESVGWQPFTSATDCIVVGQTHLAKSPSITLYLDILHEFTHILQRADGRELWDISHGYVDSPTELEAYRFSLTEARRLGVPDSFLRSYLKVEWVSPKDHQKLLKNLGFGSGR